MLNHDRHPLHICIKYHTMLICNNKTGLNIQKGYSEEGQTM